MNMSLLMLLALSFHNDIHTMWDIIDYDDPNIIPVTDEILNLMCSHNRRNGKDNITEINIYDDTIREKYQGACSLIGWANNNSVYVYHLVSDTFVRL